MSGYGSRGGGFSRSRGSDDYFDGPTSNDDIYVPARDCGKIIGRGGCKIRDLQDQSRCKIKVNRDDVGDGTRRVELSGTGEAIDVAKDLIYQILEAGDDRDVRPQQSFGASSYGGGGSNSSRETMQVNSSYVGRIIGKGGSRVRELQDETGCRINVSRNGGTCGQTDVELIGTRSQIDRAREAIEDLVSQG